MSTGIRNHIKKIMSKDCVFSILLVCSIVLSLAAVSWTMPVEKVVKSVKGYKVEKGLLKHKAYFKDNRFYGSNRSMKYYPASLVKTLVLNYTFSSVPAKTGNYTFKGVVTYFVTLGKNRYTLWEDRIFEKKGKFNKSFTASYALNVSELNRKISKTLGELKVSSLKHAISFEVTVNNGSFKHDFSLIRDSGLLHFTNTEHKLRKPEFFSRTVENRVDVFGYRVKVSELRMTSTLLAFVLPLFAYSSYLRVRRRSTREIDRYAVECEEVELNGKKAVVLSSEKDLKKIFELLDKPVMKKGDSYFVVDGDVAYVYRVR